MGAPRRPRDLAGDTSTAPPLEATFDEQGFVGPISLFEPAAALRLLARLRAAPEPSWVKGNAAASTAFFELGSDRRIVDVVTTVAGEDVLLWGAILVRRAPGEVHPWHTDIETSGAAGRAGQTVSVWIGLENTNRASSLQVIAGSHRIGTTVQEAAADAGRRRDEITCDDVAGWAGRALPGCRIDSFEMTDGDAVFFDGGLWHGTNNTNAAGVRTAVLLQYATPDRPIRIPDYGRLEWPFRLLESPLPPCLLVHGEDRFGVNRIVSPPLPGPEPGTVIGRLALPLAGDPDTGWRPHRLLAGVPGKGGALSSHASVLSAGREPHAPHVHEEEELLLVLGGRPELVLVDGDLERIEPASPGTLAYYPRGQRHTIRNPGPGDATYLMLKWAGSARDGAGPVLGTGIHRITERFAEPAGTGLAASTLFEGPTDHLAMLHSHVTTLEPGGGYEPHRDRHDVAIVLLEGAVETVGERIEPVSVVFHPAGELHGIRNVGDGLARYVVFELHGDTPGPPVAPFPAVRRTVDRARRALRR